MSKTARAIYAGLFLMAPLGCGAASNDGDGSEQGCRGGKCDDADDKLVCKVADKTGSGSGEADISANKDPIAELVLRAGEDCPEGYAAIVDKLRAQDTENCDGDERSGMRTAVVSETSQVLGRADSFRTVTARQCGGRGSHGILFSLFGLSANASSLPSTVELIAFDEPQGVFNYYTFEDGEWGFHGNSKDFIGDSGSRCAQCHTGGGLIMKELDAPWLHWEGDTTTPGASELVDKHEDLGNLSDGVDLEAIVDEGNAAWNDTRVSHLLATNDLKRVLEPLFCTVEVNIESGTSSPNGSVSFISGSALTDVNQFGQGVQVGADVYAKAIADSGQRVVGNGGQQLQDSDGNPVVDTHFPFSFPARARADAAYTRNLRDDNVIDNDFISDVSSIDFTRPIFSTERCELLRFAPQLDALLNAPDEGDSDGEEPMVETGNCCDARGESGCSIDAVQECVCDQDEFCCESEWDESCVSNVDQFNCLPAPGCGTGGGGTGAKNDVVDDLPRLIREGFIANVEAEDPDPDSPAGQLLRALRNTDDSAAHRNRVDKFSTTCGEREPDAFMADVLQVISLRRDQARALRVFEFPATLPFDDLNPAPGTRLDPLTCGLTDTFTPVIPEGGNNGGCGVFIAEVVYDARGADNGREWVKLYNSCGEAQALDGMSLGWGGASYASGGADLSGSLAAKSCLIVGGPDSDDANGAPEIGLALNFSPDLQNSGAEADGIALFAAAADDVTGATTPVDAVIYGGSNDNGLVDSTGSAPAPHVGDVSEGESIIRVDRDKWQSSETPAPTTCPDF